MIFSENSILQMHTLQWREENEEEILIGRPDIGQYIVLPKIGLVIINLLNEGYTIAEVTKKIEEETGEVVDVFDFSKDLINDYQFVYKVDENVVNPITKVKDHFPWISERLGALIFNRNMFILYFLLFASGITIASTELSYFPVYSDMFISASVTVTIIVATATAWILLFIHEFAHLIAARSVGIGSRIGLSHRLVFPVAETNMSNIVLLPRLKRYRPLLAGMSLDCALLGLGIWSLFINDYYQLFFSLKIILFIKLVNLLLFLGLAFQFMFFMKTDVYYLFVNKFECNNLLENTNLYLRKFYRQYTNEEKEEWEYINEKEKKIIRWYVWFYIVGTIWAIMIFIKYTIFQTYELILRVVENMTKHPILSWNFFDGAILILIVLTPFAIVLWSWVRIKKASIKPLIERFEK